MDKLEFENLIEKLKHRKDEGDYAKAIYIADKIDWLSIKDVNLLVFASTIYEKGHDYKFAKAILLHAYEVAPIKNRLYYPLCYINIKTGDIKDATNFYIDFCRSFPEDNRRLLLKYYILKAKGATIEQQKRALKDYIDEEKEEDLIFEYALLCDKEKNAEEVIKYCDYIVSFFGVKRDGFGERALNLKNKYTDLSEREVELLDAIEEDNKQNRVRRKKSEYEEQNKQYNDLRLEEDRRNIPVVKIERNIEDEIEERQSELRKERLAREEREKENIIDEKDVNNKVGINYKLDTEEYENEFKDDSEKPAFLTVEESDEEKKQKLKKIISNIKDGNVDTESDEDLKGDTSELVKSNENMKLKDSKLHMIIEAYSKEESVQVARKEFEYIDNFFGVKKPIVKASSYNINEKGFNYYIEKIIDKNFIIENAGQLKNEVIDEIEEFILNTKSSTIIALCDVVNNFDKMAVDREAFINRFDVYSVLSDLPQDKLEKDLETIEREAKAKQKKEELKGNSIKERKKEKVEKEVRETNYVNFEKDKDIDILENNDTVKIAIRKDAGDIKKNVKAAAENKTIAKQSLDDFVNRCRTYAESIDCVIPKKTIPAIYDRLEDLVEDGFELNEKNAILFVEDAADRAEKPKFFKKPQYDKQGCLVLTEESFKA